MISTSWHENFGSLVCKNFCLKLAHISLWQFHSLLSRSEENIVSTRMNSLIWPAHKVKCQMVIILKMQWINHSDQFCSYLKQFGVTLEWLETHFLHERYIKQSTNWEFQIRNTFLCGICFIHNDASSHKQVILSWLNVLKIQVKVSTFSHSTARHAVE